MYPTYSIKCRAVSTVVIPLKRGSGRGIYSSWHNSLFLSPLICELYFKSTVFSRWNVIVLPVFVTGASNQYAWLGKNYTGVTVVLIYMFLPCWVFFLSFISSSQCMVYLKCIHACPLHFFVSIHSMFPCSLYWSPHQIRLWAEKKTESNRRSPNIQMHAPPQNVLWNWRIGLSLSSLHVFDAFVGGFASFLTEFCSYALCCECFMCYLQLD